MLQHVWLSNSYVGIVWSMVNRWSAMVKLNTTVWCIMLGWRFAGLRNWLWKIFKNLLYIFRCLNNQIWALFINWNQPIFRCHPTIEPPLKCWDPTNLMAKFHSLKSYHNVKDGVIHANFQYAPGPRTNTRYGDRTFAIAAPKLWNSLPIIIRQSPSVESLRQVWSIFCLPVIVIYRAVLIICNVIIKIMYYYCCMFILRCTLLVC